MNKSNYKFLFVVFMSTGCATFFEDYDKKLLENKEFDQQVQIEEIVSEEATVEVAETSQNKSKAPLEKTAMSRSEINRSAINRPVVNSSAEKTKENLAENSADKINNNSATAHASAATTANHGSKNSEIKSLKSPLSEEPNAKGKTTNPIFVKHLPEIEDGEGFVGRRPQEDPFVIGEVLELSLSYFGVEAGRLKVSTRPFVNVNGNKSYHFSYEAKSSSVFSMFYSVDDRADTYVDYEQLVPYSYTISAKESKQIRDVKSYSNWKTMKAKTWDKKIKKGKEPVVEDYSWDVAPYAQNVFSAAFYLRCFQLRVGKKLAIHVAHEGKNIIMRAEIVRAEKLSTPLGTLDTFVVKPSFEIDGVFKPVGDVFLWVTNDKYKRLVRIESKIKIGKVVAAIEKITP